jgi:hypothetical protein
MSREKKLSRSSLLRMAGINFDIILARATLE